MLIKREAEGFIVTYKMPHLVAKNMKVWLLPKIETKNKEKLLFDEHKK